MIIWEEVCNLGLEPRKDGLLVLDISAVFCAVASLLLVTFPLFFFGVHPLLPSFCMDCQEPTPLLTTKGAVTL